MLPRTMMLPDSGDEQNFDDFGAPMVAPSSSSPSSSSSYPSLPPLPFSNFDMGGMEVSRWALKSDFSGKMSVLALAVRKGKISTLSLFFFFFFSRSQIFIFSTSSLSSFQKNKTTSTQQAMLIGERITGRGAVQALDLAVGVPLWEIEPVLALVVGGLLLAGLTPPREKPPPGSPPVPLNATIQALMLRAAHLGLAAAIVSEVATGQGALGLLELETGLGEVSELEAAAAFVLLVLLTNPGKGDRSRQGGTEGSRRDCVCFLFVSIFCRWSIRLKKMTMKKTKKKRREGATEEEVERGGTGGKKTNQKVHISVLLSLFSSLVLLLLLHFPRLSPSSRTL